MNLSILPMEEIRAFCERWKITKLELFGSILRDDFGPDSDIDFLMTYSPDAGWSLLDLVSMIDELKEMTGRNVDLLTRRSVERSRNWMRRKSILDSAQTIYSSDEEVEKVYAQ